MVSLKVHMHEIFIVCFETSFCMFYLLIGTKRSMAKIYEKILINSHRYSKFSITPRFRQKREAWLSVVAENVTVNLALSS